MVRLGKLFDKVLDLVPDERKSDAIELMDEFVRSDLEELYLQRLRVDPVNNTVHVCCQGTAPDSAVTDLGKVDGTFAGCVAFPGTAPAGQTDLFAGGPGR